jgi:hypothetical protein
LQLDLIEFQRLFAAALAEPATGPMAVYRNTVFHGAVEALGANFPVTRLIVGADMFEAIAVDFASDCPPRRPVLALYGERFADWMETQPWVADLPYLPDVARIERLHVESLMSADAKPLAADEARNLCRHDDFGLELHPAVRFSWFLTPAMTIWLAHQQPDESELAPDWIAEGCLFARPTPFLAHALPIGRAAHRMLFGIRLGESVDQAMSAVARLYPAEDCTALLASLVNLGVFVAHISERTR